MPEIEIRDNPKLRSFLRNITELSFTSFMWGMWVYLFLPIINIALWLLGIRYFHTQIIEKVGYMEFLGLLNKMALAVLVVFVILRLWGYYNYWRFGRRNRRKSLLPTTDEQLAEYFRIPYEKIQELKSRKEVVFSIQGDFNNQK